MSISNRSKTAAVFAASLITALFVSGAFNGVAVAKQDGDVKRIGAVCNVKSFEEGKESFKTKARGLGKLMVNLQEDTKYYKVTAKALSEIKEKEVFHVLGIVSEGRVDVEEPAVTGPLAFAMGDFPVPQVPEQLLKRRGMKWISGKMRFNEGKKYIDKYCILTGARKVAVFSEVKKGDFTSMGKGIVHVYGDLGKKEKGMRETPVAAKHIAIVDRAVPSKEYAYLFLAGVERPKPAEEDAESKPKSD